MVRQHIKTSKNKALDAAKEKIVQLTTRILVAEEKAKHAKEAVRPRGGHDDKAGPSITTQPPSSPLPPPSRASIYYQEWEQHLLDSLAVHLSQPPSNFALHY